MAKRILYRDGLRRDKTETCHSICRFLEDNDAASKSMLARVLKRPYARISGAVDWLFKNDIIQKETIGRLNINRGKREIFYAIQSGWQDSVLVNKDSLKTLTKLITKLARIIYQIKEASYEMETQYRLDMLAFPWVKKSPEAKKKRSDELLEYDAIRHTVYAIWLAFEYDPNNTRRSPENPIAPPVIDKLFDEITHFIICRFYELKQWQMAKPGRELKQIESRIEKRQRQDSKRSLISSGMTPKEVEAFWKWPIDLKGMPIFNKQRRKMQ